MVACDTCGGWYHLKCCGVTAAAARAAKKWHCPLCTAASALSPADAVAAAGARFRRTRAPPVSELHDCLAALRACPAHLPEEAALARAVADVDAWAARSAALAKAPPPAAAGGSAAAAAAAAALMEAAKEAVALETDTMPLLEQLLARLRLVRWCGATAALVDGGATGGAVDELQELIAAAPDVAGATETEHYAAATAVAKQSDSLTARARALLAAVAAAPTRSPATSALRRDLAALRSVRVELAALPVRPEALLKSVVDACTAHCICGVLASVRCGAVACDVCQTNLHLTCLGIDAAKEPRRLTCPLCCGQTGTPFAWAVRALPLWYLVAHWLITRQGCTFHCVLILCCSLSEWNVLTMC
jgi:hypothetical protein